MRKLIPLFLLLTLAVGPSAVYAEEKGASAQALEHADENAVFNRVGDWFATVGKGNTEKKQILAQRKADRTAKRAEKMAMKKKKEAEKKAKEMKAGLNKKMGM